MSSCENQCCEPIGLYIMVSYLTLFSQQLSLQRSDRNRELRRRYQFSPSNKPLRRFIDSSMVINDHRRRLRRRVNPPSLDDLPPEILQTIMLHAAENLDVYFAARYASNTLTRVTDDEAFLRCVDLLNMRIGNLAQQTVTNFRILCHHRGNVSALLMQGCSEFFHSHNLENGFSMIRESAIRGYELGIYVYSNLSRIMSPGSDLDFGITNPDRGLVRRMRSIVEAMTFRYWGPNRLPPLFLERCAAFDPGVVRRCRCGIYNPWLPPWIEDCKPPAMCDLCFYAIHALAFVRYFPERVRVWPMVYGW